MKKTFSLIIGLMCVANLGGSAFAQAVPSDQAAEPAFSDVNVGDDHYIAIKFLKDRRIIDGYADGTFQPLKEINRAEALKIILGVVSRPTDKTVAAIKTFSDVPADAWFAQYVQKGQDNGIISGYPDGLFHPERTINKVESLKMALLEENHELPVNVTDPPYSDVPVDVWFAPYAQVARDRTLFTETRSDGGALEADQTMNRGDFAELIYRLLESSNGYTFGRATYYADALAGHGTSSGDVYDPAVYTAAHKTLPFGTILRVTNAANGQSVDIKVNDRGPYATGVELDLSKSAFSAIASPSTGIIFMQYKIIQQP